MEKAKLYKQGGSTVVIIPKNYLKSLGWQRGDVVYVILEGPNKISYFKADGSDSLFKPQHRTTLTKKESFSETDRIHTT